MLIKCNDDEQLKRRDKNHKEIRKFVLKLFKEWEEKTIGNFEIFLSKS